MKEHDNHWNLSGKLNILKYLPQVLLVLPASSSSCQIVLKNLLHTTFRNNELYDIRRFHVIEAIARGIRNNSFSFGANEKDEEDDEEEN